MSRKCLRTACLTAALSLMVVAVNASASEKSGETDEFISEQNRLFGNPDISTWPEVRWWMAQGAHTDETLIDSVQTLYDRGYGGMELLTLNEQTLPNDLYGWGTEEWYHDNYVVVKKATELGMGVGFAAGPDWQPSFPYYEADPNYDEPEKWGKEYKTDPNSDVYNQGLAAGEGVYVRGGDAVSIDLTAFTYDPPANTGRGGPGGPGGGPGGMPGGQGGPPEGGMPGEPGSMPGGGPSPQQEGAGEPTLDALGTCVWGYDYDVTFRNFQTVAIARVEEEGSKVLSIEGVKQLSETEVRSLITHDEKAGIYTFNWTAPDDGNIYVVIPFWRIGAGHGTAADTDAYGTMFIVNHFTDEAARAQFNYWRKYMFTDEMVDFFKENGRIDWFMDSLEINKLNSSVEWWAYDFIDEFYETAGYDLTGYLPLLFGGYTLEGDSSTVENLVWQDYYQMLTDTYIEYLSTMKTLLDGIGVRLRAQVAYGQNFNMSQSVRGVDIPEVETLAFSDSVENYKLMSGATHLLGCNTMSSETGALRGSYVYTPREFIKQVHQQMAAGVNRAIWHGFSALAGPDKATLWPGFESAMGFDQSERWANRSPLMVTEKEYSNHIARLQTMLRAGVEKVDVGVLMGGIVSIAPWSKKDLVTESMMQDAGFSYEAFDVTYLKDPDCAFLNADGTLGRPSYKAVMVVMEEMQLESARALYKLAEKGLKVVVLEGAASTTGNYGGKDEDLAAVVAALKRLSNVKTVSGKPEIPDALDRLDVRPRVAYAKTAKLWNLMTVSDDAAYIYAFNETPEDIDTAFEVEGIYTPYVMDTWSGKITPGAVYRHENGRTVFHVSIKSGDTHVYILNPGVDAPAVYATASEAENVELFDSSLVVVSTTGGRYETTLNSGGVVATDIAVPSVQQPDAWKVTVESWTKGDKVSVTEDRGLGYKTTEVYYKTRKTDVVKDLPQTELKPWIDMPGVGKAVSGVGTYTTSMVLPGDWDFETSGLLLDLGKLEGSAEVTVNGMAMDPVNLDNPVVDISSALRKGENEISILVTSTLSNVLLNGGVNRFESTWWYPNNVPKEIEQKYGLTGLAFVPYGKAFIGKE